MNGYTNTYANVGKTKNFGVDLSLNLVPIQTKDFEWSSTINAAYQKDEIVELANGKQDDISNAWFIGESINVFYGTASDGLWQEVMRQKWLNSMPTDINLKQVWLNQLIRMVTIL